MSVKSIFQDPAWELVLVTGALVVITALLVWATRRAARSKIRVRAHAGYMDNDAFFIIRVINRGVGDVSIRGIRMIMPTWAYQGFHYPAPLPNAALKGPKLPHTLQGEHSEEWSIQPHMAIEFNNSHVRVVAPPGDIKLMKRIAKGHGSRLRVKAQVDLGNGKKAKSAVAIGFFGWQWIYRVHQEWLYMRAEAKEESAED
jgi:hypothetical protein